MTWQAPWDGVEWSVRFNPEKRIYLIIKGNRACDDDNLDLTIHPIFWENVNQGKEKQGRFVKDAIGLPQGTSTCQNGYR